MVEISRDCGFQRWSRTQGLATTTFSAPWVEQWDPHWTWPEIKRSSHIRSSNYWQWLTIYDYIILQQIVMMIQWYIYIYDNTYIYFIIYIMSPYWTFIIEPIWNLYESIWVYARRVLASNPMILEQFEGTLQLHRLDTIKARWQELDLQRLISILRICLKMDWCCCHFHTIVAPFCSCFWSCQKSMLGLGL